MDPIWIIIAFAFGLAARQVGLPPLVGFLAAGFVLNGLGRQGGETLQTVADLGVTLLLFTIGLKLRVQSLLRPQVWAVATLHIVTTVALLGAGLYGLAAAGLAAFAGLDITLALLIAFALSFSSTVFAVKVLEDMGEMSSLHGRISIGILIMQDIAAVVFLAASTGKIPSIWALGLLALIPLRGVLGKVMERAGHGELLMLYGLFLALGGYALFELVNLKGDLGALIVGVLLAGHPKAKELARSLLGFKDLFLVGFFLSIGLSGTPTLPEIGIALLLVTLVPLKVGLFFWLMTRFNLRARTSALASLSLANYSEFGLIVGAIAVSNGWLGGGWLAAIAVAVAVSFVAAAPLNAASHAIYARLDSRLRSFESAKRLPEDALIDPGTAEIAVFGMGRVGTAAYEAMRARFGDVVIGVDYDPQTVATHKSAGRRVILGDATDADFWEKVRLARMARPEHRIKLTMLAMPSHKENLYAVEQLKNIDYKGVITAIAKYADELKALREAGVHAAYNIYAEAGLGFADHVSARFEKNGVLEPSSAGS